MYKVIHEFKDLQDNDHIYNVGDIYPFDGKEISEERYQELSSKNNLIGKILIQLEENSDMKNLNKKDVDAKLKGQK